MWGTMGSRVGSLIVRRPGETFMTGGPRPLSRDFVRYLACVVGLALIVSWVSLGLRIHTRGDTLHNLGAILHGQPLLYGEGADATLPFYNRILFPGLHAASSALFPVLTPGQWYILLRVISFEAAFVLFALACYRSLKIDVKDFFVAAALLALSTLVTFGFGWEDPSDALDMAALCLGVLCAIEGRLVLCCVAAVFFAANRESAAYLGILWYFLSPQRSGRTAWRTAVEGFVISAASYATVLALRFTVSETGRSNRFELPNIVHALTEEFEHFSPISALPLLMAVLVTITATVALPGPLARRFALLAAVFTVPALMFGWVRELRVFLPCFVMLCFAVGAGGTGRSSSPSRPIRPT